MLNGELSQLYLITFANSKDYMYSTLTAINFVFISPRCLYYKQGKKKNPPAGEDRLLIYRFKD